MSADANEPLDDYYKVISNKNAWKIINYIGENGSVRATKAIRDLNISAGLFYDTLKRFDNIIQKQEDGTYTLNERGRIIYELIKQDDARLRGAYSITTIRFIYKLKPLFPLELFRRLDKISYYYKILMSVVIILSFSLISGITNVRAILIYGWPAPYASFSEIVTWYVINVLILFFITFSIIKLFNRKASILNSFTMIPITLWPQAVYMLMVWLIRITQGYYPRFSYLAGAGLSILTVFALSSYLYSIGKVNIEYSIIISLLLFIISLLAILIVFI
jgi:hypothetical protein